MFTNIIEINIRGVCPLFRLQEVEHLSICLTTCWYVTSTYRYFYLRKDYVRYCTYLEFPLCDSLSSVSKCMTY